MEALIVRSNSSSSEALALQRSRRKSTLYFGFLALIVLIILTSAGFLWSAGEETTSSTTKSDGTTSKLKGSRPDKTPSKNVADNSTSEDDFDHDVIAAKQIENFRNGNGLMINVHITHHGKLLFALPLFGRGM